MNIPHEKLNNGKKHKRSLDAMKTIYNNKLPLNKDSIVPLEKQVNLKLNYLEDYIFSIMSGVNIASKETEPQLFQDIEKAFNKININQTSKMSIIEILAQKKEPELPLDTSTLIADFIMKGSKEPVSVTENNELSA
ncbi:hypothetical protein [Piscirickettsia salmonis]|uniref:hypothetical protein n=1 Tax=Piscirickettsia salmonis TaxID=1238 RepID=UPI0007C91982|nr:hypothetical protein A0O36_00769 [Piscirickettsiaceae bacterium NZ-RLO1]